jgi:hypothetical protein
LFQMSQVSPWTPHQIFLWGKFSLHAWNLMGNLNTNHTLEGVSWKDQSMTSTNKILKGKRNVVILLCSKPISILNQTLLIPPH